MVVVASVGEALGSAVDALAAAGVATPRLDAELLLEAASGHDRATLTAEPEVAVGARAARDFGAMVRRRVGREPVAYILGRKGFRGIELEVDARVLIPRPETELLVELAVELGPTRVVDVGTGSGAVALAVADELPAAVVVATDTSAAALSVAESNAARLGLADRVRFESGTLPAGVGADLLLANLPYVREAEWAGLEPEITRFEPRAALVGGEDGLAAIRSLATALARVEAPERPPIVALEVGEGQARDVGALLAEVGYEPEVRRDLAGIERCVVGRS